MRAGVLWLIPFFALVDTQGGFLGGSDGVKTQRAHGADQRKPAVQEYELLLQMTYRDSKEKRALESLLQLLKSPSPCLHVPVKMIRAKATTYCRRRRRGLSCFCEDGYAWFPPSCLEPQRCRLRTEGAVTRCQCHHGSSLGRSVNFCERAKVWGTFKINERFTKDLWDSSSVIYADYKNKIESQLQEVYEEIPGFDSVHVTQFREGSIVVGYEVIGSSSLDELLSSIMQMAGKAKAALGKLFPLEDGSFRVFRKAHCNSVSFGFGAEEEEFALPCSSGYSGTITVRCLAAGWQVRRDSCVLSRLKELQKSFSVIAGNATEEDVSSLVQNLSDIIQESPSTTAGNLAAVVSILGNISSLSMAKHLKVSNVTLKNVIGIADHILNSASVTNWTVLLRDDKRASSQLLETLENISVLVPSTALPLTFSGEFIDWKGIPMTQSQDHRSYSYEVELFQQNSSVPVTGRVFIQADQFQTSLPEAIVSMASLTFGNILPTTASDTAQVNGPVISTLIPNFSLGEIFLRFSKARPHRRQPRCVFWDFSRLRWDGAGCHLVNETPEAVLCRCTHLTSFSMLMSPSVPPEIVPTVTWITHVGLGVSVVSLLLCLAVEALCWKQTRKSPTSFSRHVCLVNIALSLLVADVWFLVAVTRDPALDASGVCSAAVFFTHLFYLSLFFWMLALALLLAYRVLLVFHHTAMSLMMALGFCLGYGCPLLIAVVTVAVTLPSRGYQRTDVCWLNWSPSSKPLLAFVVPALAIVAVNSVVVLLVLRKLWRPAVGEGLHRDDRAVALRVGKSLLILTPWLGLTWGFGIGTMVDSRNAAWHVLFALFNAFQGFFILCFGILSDGKLRQILCNKLCPLNSWKQTSKQNSSDTSSKPKCLKPVHLLQNKGHYTLSHSGSSSTSITLTQFLSNE
ncbi:adhesion G-protein coupled receptor F1 [Perognathus longimembris pacificus]|uniref:adhesion G-protein coupled receptor F1 n=1 Tax=Perognathus longimembris pacificus TaxID=214514 RepID=UPI002018C1AB|nr:adhesion G-protein coupled receptor F1 [Perognathus longimembris pacificus]